MQKGHGKKGGMQLARLRRTGGMKTAVKDSERCYIMVVKKKV